MQELIPLSQLHTFYLISGDEETSARIEQMLATRGVLIQHNQNFFSETFESFDIEAVRGWNERARMRRDVDTYFVVTAREIPSEAQNALLKVSEEPVVGVYIFFIVPDAFILLPTLRSRAQVIVDENEESVKLAQTFFSANLAERFVWIAKFIKKYKDEGETSTLLRSETKKFFQALQKVVYEKKEKLNVEILDTLLTFNSYLNQRGSSPKMLLEHVAMLLK